MSERVVRADRQQTELSEPPRSFPPPQFWRIIAFSSGATVALADGDGAVTGAAGGAVAGAVVGGPVGAAVGGVAGGVIGGVGPGTRARSSSRLGRAQRTTTQDNNTGASVTRQTTELSPSRVDAARHA